MILFFEMDGQDLSLCFRLIKPLNKKFGNQGFMREGEDVENSLKTKMWREILMIE